jgi:hypothetical protein
MRDYDKLVSIKMGKRCTCYQQTAFDHQCCHKLCSEGAFYIERFDCRWLNEKTFQQIHPNFWLVDHLPEYLNKEDEASIEEK